MRVSKVCVLGGSGFVGRHVLQLLARAGVAARVPVRDRERAKRDLIILPAVDLVAADVHDPAQLADLLSGVDAVINLVAILHEHGRGEFERVHVELPRKIVEACRTRGVRRLVHVSALNAAADGPSLYLRTKGEAEALLRAATDLDVTIFRPSVIFGRGDSFLTLFALLQRWLPLVALGSPNARFQPVYVGDVAQALVASLADVGTYGQSYDLCGPKVYTLRELVALAGRLSGHPRPIVGLPDGLSYLQAAAMEWLPVKLLTRDNYNSMKRDSVCRCAFPFGIEPEPLEAIAPTYLAPSGPRVRYRLFRDRAGR